MGAFHQICWCFLFENIGHRTATNVHRSSSSQNSCLFFALAAFGLWGLVQPIFRALYPYAPLAIVAHRTIWSCLFIWVWLALRGKIGGATPFMTDWKTLLILALTGMLIFVNWGFISFRCSLNACWMRLLGIL